jgi:superfamily II DNA or RNA helicase
VLPFATQEDITRAYTRLSYKYKPSRNPIIDTSKKYKTVLAAYKDLHTGNHHVVKSLNLNNVVTYLGSKGYAVYKDSIKDTTLQDLKDELVASATSNILYGPPDKFELYRECATKLYMPRHFGIAKFGMPMEIRLPQPETATMPFLGKLRDYQDNIVDEYMNHLTIGGGLLEIPCGRGKTVMGLKIASLIGLKTLVIVHKEFLAEQWIERIQQFLPNARIGRIQGKVIDIDNKDIVIGMLQTLSKTSYPSSIIGKFGLTIVDEVHHIAAKVFVRSLFQIVTTYMVGLSATMKRIDGLSYVFEQFIGKVIYKEEAEANKNVEVRRYMYSTDDEVFNKTEVDMRGNTAFSTMMTKLCVYNKRSDYIINIISEIMTENPRQQILVLGHYRNMLTYIHDKITDSQIGTVGYYVGGMKQSLLKESERKQIIIATYSMAAEALDIKTLTTLVLATPKKDVVQPIGRILRSGGGLLESTDQKSSPLVIDIIDSHDVFKRHASDRKRYYKKQGYNIRDMNIPRKDTDISLTLDSNECCIKII